ncbi:cyclin-domain-containing protein [Circinella umbellata]|nr:cyclin-domain-containing protein [Circinella umbellata]
MQPPSFDLSKYPTVETIRLLASLLERMTAANDQINRASTTRKDNVRRASSASLLGSSQVQGGGSLVTSNSSAAVSTPPPPSPAADTYTKFSSRSLPSIDIFSYLSRIFKYCPCANECFLSLLVYFDRMSKNALALKGRPFTIDSYNIHRLIIAGVMVSSKFFSDVFYTNTRYAKVGGLPVAELNSLELEFLVLNGFNLSVPISELQRYGDQLLKVGYMEQEMLKSIMYETPSYNPVRHGRSTSLGSAMVVRHPITGESTINNTSNNSNNNTNGTGQVDQLCEMTSRVSLDERIPQYSTSTASNTSISSGSSAAAAAAAAAVAAAASVYNSYPQQQQSHHIPKMSSNGSLNMVRRMGSYGNLHQSPQVFNAPMTNQDSLHSPIDLDDSRSSYSPHHQRHSFNMWRHSSSSPPPQQHYTRQRHGSMGFSSSPSNNNNNDNTSSSWQHRMPRQSRSSVNLCQQAGFRKSTPPPGFAPTDGFVMPQGDPAMAAAVAAAAAANGYGTPYYTYQQQHNHHHPLGIPTPPPSSSPIHQKQGTPSPYQSSVMYL